MDSIQFSEFVNPLAVSYRPLPETQTMRTPKTSTRRRRPLSSLQTWSLTCHSRTSRVLTWQLQQALMRSQFRYCKPSVFFMLNENHMVFTRSSYHDIIALYDVPSVDNSEWAI